MQETKNTSETNSTNKTYSSNYHAMYMRKKRQQMIEKDPIFTRQYVWVIEGDGKQMVFKNKRDITIKKINKKDLQTDYIKAY